MIYGVIENLEGVLGTVRIIDGVAVPDEGALKVLENAQIRDENEKELSFSDGPRFLAWLAIRMGGTYQWVRLEEGDPRAVS